MTLKEKFNDLVHIEFGNMQEPLLTECENLADEYAQKFAEWVIKTKTYNTGIDYKNLLKMYKNQKGL